MTYPVFCPFSSSRDLIWRVLSETDQRLDLSPLNPDHKIRGSLIAETLGFSSSMSCRSAETGCLPKEGLHYEDWQRPNQTSLHQGGLQSWPFTELFPHYDTQNHTQGWGFNMLMRHDDAWENNYCPQNLCAQLPVSPCPCMLRYHFFPTSVSLQICPRLCLESQLEGLFPLCCLLGTQA